MAGVSHIAELLVPAMALDAYFSANSRVDLIKIDIEGAEAQALAGMGLLLRVARPIVVTEFHGKPAWASRAELFTTRYKLFDMNGRKIDAIADTQPIYHCFALVEELGPSLANRLIK